MNSRAGREAEDEGRGIRRRAGLERLGVLGQLGDRLQRLPSGEAGRHAGQRRGVGN